MELQKIIDAVKHNDNLENNYNLALYWFKRQQYDRAEEWARKALKHKETAAPNNINLLNYLIVKTLFSLADDDISVLKSALPFIEKIKQFEGDKYMNMSEGLSTRVEAKIASLEKDNKADFMPFTT